ncbi:hypothetical protein EXN66_Car008424 [Channa argus]|uniref:Uncharacterized protein n=1 Tax=Channa argus TaxID=215402 RepID=A0A6G1PRY8_CHAAH|nr:hypothetical protein EXN66_Car008424 [Channa argus]
MKYQSWWPEKSRLPQLNSHLVQEPRQVSQSGRDTFQPKVKLQSRLVLQDRKKKGYL